MLSEKALSVAYVVDCHKKSSLLDLMLSVHFCLMERTNAPKKRRSDKIKKNKKNNENKNIKNSLARFDNSVGLKMSNDR